MKSTSGNAGSALNSSSTKSTGSKFKQLLFKIIGVKNSPPVAYVRRGREVTFEKVPFFNSQGEKLSLKTVNKNGITKTVAKREGRISGVRRGISDPVTLRENMLSRNKGISQAIPKFQKRAKNHLKETQILRAGIVSGELETPGNQNGRLLKKLKEEERKDGIIPSEAWLAQVRQHVNKKANSGKDQLNAIAQALKQHAKNNGKDSLGEMKKKVELLDPTKPRVEKFQPQKIDPKTGTPIQEVVSEKPKGLKPSVIPERDLKNGPKKTVSKVHNFSKIPISNKPVEENKGKDNSKVIGRITIEERKISASSPKLENLGKSHDLLKKLKSTPVSKTAYSKVTPDDSNLKAKVSKPTIENTVSKSSEIPHVGENKKDSQLVGKNPIAAKAKSSEHVHSKHVKQDSHLSSQVKQEAVPQSKPVESAVKTAVASVAGKLDQSEVSKKSSRSRRKGSRIEKPKGLSKRGLGNSRQMESTSASSTNKLGQPEPAEIKPVDEAAQALKNMVTAGSREPVVVDTKVASTAPNGTISNQTTGSGADIPKSIENLQEVLKKLETHAKILTGEGKTTLKVRLKPANLGALTVHIRESNGRYDVAMRTETPEAARLVESQMHAVREQLSNQGIEVDKFVVDAGSDKNNSLHNQTDNQRESKSGQGTNRQRFKQGSEEKQPRDDQEPKRNKQSRLNVGTNTVDYVY